MDRMSEWNRRSGGTRNDSDERNAGGPVRHVAEVGAGRVGRTRPCAVSSALAANAEAEVNTRARDEPSSWRSLGLLALGPTPPARPRGAVPQRWLRSAWSPAALGASSRGSTCFAPGGAVNRNCASSRLDSGVQRRKVAWYWGTPESSQ